MADWMDSLPAFDAGALPAPFTEAADRARTGGRLSRGLRRHTGHADRRIFHNLRRQAQADKMLERLPAAGEVLHLVLDGAFDLCHLIPRVVELAGEACERLDLATLGFNDATLEVLNQLADAGQVGRIRLLCSHYFRSVDTELWSRAHEALTRRGHAAFIARNHAKLQLYTFAGGRLVTLMSSANLRSCKNAEFALLFADADVHRFWSSVIDELIEESRKCEAASPSPGA
jgi:hypothetical protein